MTYEQIVKKLSDEEYKILYDMNSKGYIKTLKINISRYDSRHLTLALSIIKDINIRDIILHPHLPYKTQDKIQRVLLDKRIKKDNIINKINLLLLEQ